MAVASEASLLPVDARMHLFRACGACQHFLTKSPLLFVYIFPVGRSVAQPRRNFVSIEHVCVFNVFFL